MKNVAGYLLLSIMIMAVVLETVVEAKKSSKPRKGGGGGGGGGGKRRYRHRHDCDVKCWWRGSDDKCADCCADKGYSDEGECTGVLNNRCACNVQVGTAEDVDIDQ